MSGARHLTPRRPIVQPCHPIAQRNRAPVFVEYQLQDRPDTSIEGTLYFVVAEALTNVAKYAQASEVTVSVVRSGDTLVLDVSDDGVGGADRTRGSGLRGLVDRAAVVDGTLDIQSSPGGGTRLTCRVPVAATPSRSELQPDETRTSTPLGAGQ